ncbi:coiled-coil domain-containing protein 181 isoform X1 [Diceros bicornis minor]|uniref:coiled-coil domain-containing protein 181 isoform X1 n=1 Tax=Diceros bicornis minor TaxID=77932 RepID=UPI0026E966EB|nr:coiled-coil domain-containing protein 181 isoform X1 [Diceros bicornis minor]XP_058396095.1 coiled-coil domain-containing protein 181 isoform X1 [Diceros bicornis minor]XP_058396096.1 coiled-coil domain-containing protein 181 isoform X1 [Diceros bicornis minor]XP_058396097.1 coiled-coil domain-containing protein 181 isoform X1 [Diceros bicornis minor]
MEENKDTDSKESGEYEEDFEKDLEWLINEKEKNGASIMEMACGNEENINQELKENETEIEHTKQLSDPDKSLKDEVSSRRNDFISVPSIQPLDPISDSDSENSFQESKLESQKDLEEEEDEEVRRYIMEKIIQANKLLQNQEPVNDKRERKLKFKDKLVDLEVPPLDDTDTYKNHFENERNVSGKLSQLCISNEFGQENVLLSLTDGSCEENKDGKILVERDGKFELLNLQDIESQGFLPPINNANNTENEPQQLSPRSSNSSVSGVKKEEPIARIHAMAHSSTEETVAYIPQPPPNPKTRPSSAANSDRSKENGKSNHRTQSANISPVTSTYCLSPRQKELQKRLEQKREKLKREEEQRKIEEEKEKKKENDMVFKVWLQKKREQVLEMRRIQRAKQIEDMNSRQENRDPQQAFRLWLKKKHEEQLKERKTEELRKQEECLYFLKGTEGRERAFKLWLRRKRIEKLAEQQAAKERARQLRLEAKHSKHLQYHLYNMPEAKSFRFTDPYN